LAAYLGSHILIHAGRQDTAMGQATAVVLTTSKGEGHDDGKAAGAVRLRL
jgi:hypothetical protein